MNSKVAGYFTVEAALVFPMVLGTIFLLIYLGFFQYDRCMLEFDIGALALKGCCSEESDKEAVLDEVEKAAREIYVEKYIAWETADINAEIDGKNVRVEGSGSIRFPFGALVQKGLYNMWNVKAEYENRRMDPVTFIRTYKKIVGGE